MRKTIQIGAIIVLATTAAQAGENRGLSLTATDSALTRPADASQRTAENAQPMAAPATPSAPATAAAPIAAAPATAVQPPSQMSRRQHAARAAKPRSGRWSQARIVSELHRHGIYW